MAAPLADRIRPQTLDDVVGQEHLLGRDKVLRRMVESGNIPNLIFYGPSGVGKTTVASIIAKRAGKKLCKLNGTTASTSDIRDVVGETNTIDGIGGVILYLDEIQYLNKKQQQTLLEFIENGSITLIASTTENPYFYVYNAVLSRSTVFEFKPVQPQAVQRAVQRAFEAAGEAAGRRLEVEDGVYEYIASACARRLMLLNCLRSRLVRIRRSHWRKRGRWRRKAPCATTVTGMSIMISFPRCKSLFADRMRMRLCII